MDMVPASVGRASCFWDEQQLDLHAAATQIGRAARGFTPDVALAAQRFVRAWERHAAEAATLCEHSADGLRDTVADWIATDGGVSLASLALLPYLEEVR